MRAETCNQFYANGQATFRWYDGNAIPGDWEGKWEEYKAGWYISENAAIRLGPRGPDDFFILPKSVFDECCPGDWAKLQGADPANFTPEQQSILYAGALLRINETPYGKAMKEMGEMIEASLGRITIGRRSATPTITTKALSPSVQRKLGGLASRANEKLADVIRSRGGNASNVRQAGPWAEKTLVETAQAAVQGNAEAGTAIKIAKEAGRLGKKH